MEECIEELINRVKKELRLDIIKHLCEEWTPKCFGEYNLGLSDCRKSLCPWSKDCEVETYLAEVRK